MKTNKVSSNKTINKLKKKFDFPSKKPALEEKLEGWFQPGNKVMLKKYLHHICGSKKNKIVIEFGTWLGLSADFIVNNISDSSYLICVDMWEGDLSIGNMKKNKKELYNQYIVNMWKYKNKIIPVKMDGKKAMKYLSELGIKPDLIYLDMGHEYLEVYPDLVDLVKYFPNVPIIGDDYLFWNGVKKAVLQIREEKQIPYLDVDYNCYALLYDKKYMTYDNDQYGKNINKYKNQELQYSFIPNKVKCNNRVFIIPILQDESNNFNRYKSIIDILTDKDSIIFIKNVSKKFMHRYSLYNIGYLCSKDKSSTYFFIDPEQFMNNSDLLTKEFICTENTLLSIVTKKDRSIDPYSNLGTISMSNDVFIKLDGFQHSIFDNILNRYFLFNKIINNKIVIDQIYINNKNKINNVNNKDLIIYDNKNNKMHQKLDIIKSKIKLFYKKHKKHKKHKNLLNIKLKDIKYNIVKDEIVKNNPNIRLIYI